MQTILAVHPALEEAAYDLTTTIGEAIEHVPKAYVFGVVVAAMQSQAAPSHHPAVGEVMDGYGMTELAAAEKAAEKVADPWAELRGWAEDPTIVDLFKEMVRKHASAATAPASGMVPFDLDGDPEGPRWIVEGLLERGFIHLGTGDTGSAKSLAMTALMAAGLRGEKFMGRDVRADRFMYIDGENPKNVVQARYKAFGLTNEHINRIHFTGREAGVQLGDPKWDSWLRRQVEDFRPDVLVIDTVAKCCNVSMLDNDSVVALYRDVLVPLVTEADCALVPLHHERKGHGGGTGDRSQMAMGARQWVDQADAHLTFAHTGKFERDAEGNTRRPFALRTPKHRWADEDTVQHFEVTGKQREDRTPIKLAVKLPTQEPTTAERIIAAVGEGRLGRKAVAEGKRSVSTFVILRAGAGFRGVWAR